MRQFACVKLPARQTAWRRRSCGRRLRRCIWQGQSDAALALFVSAVNMDCAIERPGLGEEKKSYWVASGAYEALT